GETPAPTARQTFYPVSPGNYRLEVDSVAAARGDAANWYDGIEPAAGPDVDQSLALLQAIRRKNELYFHRWRPQNITYLLLFRKHEQGNNAVEIPQFDPLVAEEEERIDELKRPKERTYRLIREA